MALYFYGKGGRFVVNGFADDLFKVSTWEYTREKTLIDITNTNAFGKEQYISNLLAGTITASGFVTDDEFISLFDDPEQFGEGLEIKVDLYFEFEADFGFKNIDAIIDTLTFNVDNAGACRFELQCRISEPKI